VDRGGTDDRAFVTGAGVGVEGRFGTRFLKRRQARGQLLWQLQVYLRDPRLRDPAGVDASRGDGHLEGRAVRFAAMSQRGRRELGSEPQALAAADLKAARQRCRGALGAGEGAFHVHRAAVGGVELEARPVDVDQHAFEL
jgi:hypothetical protein